MDTKGLSRVEIKDADKGTVSAVFATFGVVDSDGDVTKAGAFEDGAPVRISAYQHTSWQGALPVGKGVIRQTKNEAIMDGRFFLNTTAGRDTFEVVKELGGMQEWSYGFDVEDSAPGEGEVGGKAVRRVLNRLKTHEVSPVLLGAGVGTRTLAVKAATTTFLDEASAVMAAVTSLGDRAADVMAKRTEKGKALGADSAYLLEQVEAELKRLHGLLRQDEPAEPDPGLSEALHREFLRFMRPA